MNDAATHEANFGIDEFAAIVSHDFRAPIRHINQFVAILVDTLEDLDEDQKVCVEHIRNSVKQCNEMMTGLAQIARINQCSQELSSIDLTEAFNLCAKKLTAIYGTKPNISVRVHDDYNVQMKNDHLHQLLYAIIDNSFKFHENIETLTLTMDVHVAQDNLQICITDNGPGMPDSFIAHSAAVFNQLSPGSAGCGIGLTHASHIAHHYGGELSVAHNGSSQAPGQGTKIEINIPLNCLDQAA